jgi:hypothetical protein
MAFQELTLNQPQRLAFQPNATAKPYRHEAYPSVRFHPDGRSHVVKTIEEDRALGEPWADIPYPPVDKPAPAPDAAPLDPTVPLQAKITELEQENTDLRSVVTELRGELRTLKTAAKNKTEKAGKE